MTATSDVMEHRLRTAFDRTLDALGEPSKKAILYHLTDHGGLDMESPGLTIGQVEKALTALLGLGAAIVMGRLYEELARLDSHSRY
jgi:hypothetical protein